MRSAYLLVVLAVLPACAENIEPATDPDAGPGTADRVSTVRNPDGTYTTRVDATSTEAWTAIDLETGAEAETGWDLSTQRFHLKLSGGASGDSGVEVAPVVDAVLADVTEAPTSGWITDAADGDDDNTEPDYAFEQGEGWYAYDPVSHLLTPRPVVWVIRTSDDNLIKLTITDYYDDAGTAGHFTLQWAPLGGGS